MRFHCTFLAIVFIVSLATECLSTNLYPLVCDEPVPYYVEFTTNAPLILAGGIASIGIFEANAIQFGTDQLLFIHPLVLLEYSSRITGGLVYCFSNYSCYSFKII